MPKVSAPSTVSPAARRIIDEAPPIPPIELEPVALAAARQLSLDTYGTSGRALAARLGLSIEEAKLGGVPVQWVVPGKAEAKGVILYCYGGGYVYGSPSEDLAITARLAAFTRRKVCAVHYRRAPEHPFPAPREDALAVYRALLEARIGPIVVAGESAGGNLALALIHVLAAQGLPLPVAAGLLSPWCDLTHTGDTIATLDGADPIIDGASGLAFARAYANGRPLDDPAISPLFAAVPKGFPPTLITTGTRDLLLSDCARLSTKLRQAGVAAELRVWEGMWHVFEYYAELPEGEASLKEIAAFLEARMAG